MGDARSRLNNHPASSLILGCARMLPVLFAQACGEPPSRTGFSIDTLPSGRIEISNPQEGSWGPGEAWEVEEVYRLGSEDADSPELFSFIPDL